MNLKDVIIVGVALAMDAVGVAIGIGVNSKVKRKNKIAFIISFAFFQFLFFFMGGVGGHLFQKYVTTIPNVVGGIAIAIVGALMIKEGIENGSNDKDEILLLKSSMVIILGVSVSIDALVVGFTAIKYISNMMRVVNDSAVIGGITLILCTFAFYFCRYIRRINFISRYADFFGGATLIIFAIKMIFF